MATTGQTPWNPQAGTPTGAAPVVVRTAAYLAANPTLPDVPPNTVVIITP